MKKFIFCAIGIFILGCNSSNPVNSMPKSDVKEAGGGDAASQEFSAALHRLPETLQAYGLSLFPEVNLEKIKDLVNDPGLRIEKANGGIVIQGARKDALNISSLKLIQVDNDAITSILSQSDADERLSALAFHEILGLMGLEGNDDYHISNRLLSNSKKSIECSDNDSKSISLRLRLDYLRVIHQCIIPGGVGEKTCVDTAYQVLPTGNDVVESSPTEFFVLDGNIMTLHKGGQKKTILIHDSKKFNGSQAYTFYEGGLNINWKNTIVNPAGQRLAVGQLDLNSERVAVFCKRNN